MHLSQELAEGNWNSEDIRKIKEVATVKCRSKLEKYSDIGENKHDEVNGIIENIMMDLELV